MSSARAISLFDEFLRVNLQYYEVELSHRVAKQKKRHDIENGSCREIVDPSDQRSEQEINEAHSRTSSVTALFALEKSSNFQLLPMRS